MDKERLYEQWKKNKGAKEAISSRLVEHRFYEQDSNDSFVSTTPGISFLLHGEIHYQIGDDEARLLKAGEYLFYPKGVSIHLDIKKGTSKLLFPLTKEITEHFLELLKKYRQFSPELLEAPNRVCIMQEKWDDRLEQLIVRLLDYQEEENSDFFIHLILCEMMYYIFPNEHMLSKISYVMEAYYYPDTIQRVESFMLENYFQALRIKNIVEVAQVSESHLNRLYKKYFQMSPMERLAAIRMEQAALLLKKPSFNVTEVALQVGYQSMSAFVQQFKKRFHLSPKEYQTKKK